MTDKAPDFSKLPEELRQAVTDVPALMGELAQAGKDMADASGKMTIGRVLAALTRAESISLQLADKFKTVREAFLNMDMSGE